MSEPSLPDAPEVEFVLELGRALLVTGTPAHRFEDTLARVTMKLGLKAQFFALPTGFFSYIHINGTQHTYFLRGHSGSADLGKISAMHEITEALLDGRQDFHQASACLRALLAAPPSHPPMLALLAHGLFSACFAVFLKGGWREALLGSLLGAFVGALTVFFSQRPTLNRVLPVVGATVASVLSVIACHWVVGTSSLVVTLSALAVLIPGLGVIIAMNELATGNLMAGTARSMSTLMVLLQLFSGWCWPSVSEFNGSSRG
jgi:uncharacterized membrane protein YjjP (DUF1212 family)